MTDRTFTLGAPSPLDPAAFAADFEQAMATGTYTIVALFAAPFRSANPHLRGRSVPMLATAQKNANDEYAQRITLAMPLGKEPYFSVWKPEAKVPAMQGWMGHALTHINTMFDLNNATIVEWDRDKLKNHHGILCNACNKGEATPAAVHNGHGIFELGEAGLRRTEPLRPHSLKALLHELASVPA